MVMKAEANRTRTGERRACVVNQANAAARRMNSGSDWSVDGRESNIGGSRAAGEGEPAGGIREAGARQRVICAGAVCC